MKTLLDQLLDQLRSEMTPEVQARIDAEADRLEAEGAEVRWGPDPFGPDPFGDNWAWADPALDTRAAETTLRIAASRAQEHVVEPARGGLFRKSEGRLKNSAFLAIAASLLIGLSLGLLMRQGSSATGVQVALADVSLLSRGNARAGDGAKDYFLDVSQPFDGYVSWVLLVAGDAPEVFPTLGGELRRVATGKREAIGPMPPAAEVIVVITEQPANDFLRQQVDAAEFRTGDGSRIKDGLVQALTDANYKRISVAVQKVPAEPAK